MPSFSPPVSGHFTTGGGFSVTRTVTVLAGADQAVQSLVRRLDDGVGMVMACDVTQPGRYTPRLVGFDAPPLMVEATGRNFTITALNGRGRVLLPCLGRHLDGHGQIRLEQVDGGQLSGTIPDSGEPADERARTRRASVFTLVRALRQILATGHDHHLGLYGAFGYDLGLQIDPVRRRLPRPADQRDVVLYLPDRLILTDGGAAGLCLDYDFACGADGQTQGIERQGFASSIILSNGGDKVDDHAPGAYAQVVERALDQFRQGNLFEVVPSQTFSRPLSRRPSDLFRRLRAVNPAPYGLLANLGRGEALVSISPEMFVRANRLDDGGVRVETAPISGTIARGADAMGDADAVLALLSSEKEAAELTMCTDVDRNDKAKVCRPGSVQVIGRRQIEMYSRLIHTVDHVQGVLDPQMDALDAFLAHAWAVTVTGAPKKWAMQFIEDNEAQSRRWYGGAFGAVLADGGLDTGLTLRTLRLADGRAEIRAGATLLMDSQPQAEDRECRLKASALLAVLDDQPAAIAAATAPRSGTGRRVLVVDHDDSFVHTLADYIRQTGAETLVVRHGAALAALDDFAPDLAVLSPGPGRPVDFALSDTIKAALDRRCAIFGICLGMQGITEYFGGALALGEPAHGRMGHMAVVGDGGRVLAGLPSRFQAGRYHSLHAREDALPGCLTITARLDSGGMIMALEHRDLPVAGVQFHPESLLTCRGGVGHALIDNVMTFLC